MIVYCNMECKHSKDGKCSLPKIHLMAVINTFSKDTIACWEETEKE